MIRIGMAKIDLEEALQPGVPVREERVEAIALFIGSDRLRAVWIALDFMDFNLLVVNTLKAAVHAKTGIEEEHIHILTTHNHGGGEPVLEILARLSADCTLCAMNSAVPARMRYAITQTDRQVSYTRRMWVPELDGVTTFFFGTSEKTGFDSAPHVEHAVSSIRKGVLQYRGAEPTSRPFHPFAPGDPDIAAVEFEDMYHNPIGSIIRFAAHATCCNRPGSHSSDYPWHTRRYMERVFGGVSLFLNGPCADIAPGNVDKLDGTERVLGIYLAETALKALAAQPFEPVTAFADGMTTLSLPVRREVLDNTVELPETMPETLPERRRYLERASLRDTLPFLEEKYREGETALTGTMQVKVGFARLNNFIVAAFPGETFHATGHALRQAFPAQTICTVTEHDRTAMYIPPETEYMLGGYESVCMAVAPGAETTLRTGVMTAMEEFLSGHSINTEA